MKIIVGLGNPGKEYQNTRHNTGWLVVDELTKNLKQVTKIDKVNFINNKKINAEIAEVEYKGEKIVLVKPQTYMNESGLAVTRIFKFYNEAMQQLSNDLWVIHDDLDLSLGTLKIVTNRSSAGHKGVQSIMDHLKTQDFVRFRIGIGFSQNYELRIMNYEDYVLNSFKGKDQELFVKMIDQSAEAVRFALENGLKKAMEKYN